MIGKFYLKQMRKTIEEGILLEFSPLKPLKKLIIIANFLNSHVTIIKSYSKILNLIKIFWKRFVNKFPTLMFEEIIDVFERFIIFDNCYLSNLLNNLLIF